VFSAGFGKARKFGVSGGNENDIRRGLLEVNRFVVIY
jgi:hypothetical protein